MADLMLILALAVWLTLWLMRDTGHTQVRRGTGLRWARRRVTPPSPRSGPKPPSDGSESATGHAAGEPGGR